MLSREISTPFWSVEHRGRSFTRNGLTTAWRTLRPGAFWAAMNLSNHRRWGRIVVFIAIGTGLVTAAAGLIEAAFELEFGWLSRTPLASLWGSNPVGLSAFVIDAMTSPFGLWSWSSLRGYRRGLEIDFVWLPLFVVLCPVVYALIPTTLGRCRVRRVHLLVAFAYGLPRVCLWLEALYLMHLLVFRLLLSPYGFYSSHRQSVMLDVFASGAVWMFGLFVCQWRWWSAVNRSYLRLARPRSVTAAMLTIAGLVVLILMFGCSSTGAEILFELLW